MMQKLLGLKWLAPLAGLVALAFTIWMVGPQIAYGTSRPLESPTVRIVVILVIVLLFVLNQLRKLLKANQANKGMVEGIVEAKAAPDPDRSEEEVAALNERFDKAIAVLKQAKGKRGRLSLYDLPWYIIIGPPGSGKTTALVNSGLEFPLADTHGREALAGVGGTRNCDWWFTDEAILLDTAGRYTTQDSDAAVDKSAWEGFLGLLKKYRKRRPINGVIVAISLLDLMTLNEHERLAHARAIKARIQELDKFFKIRFPVYVILTKADLVAGFMEFFDDLGREAREQVWGATYPIEASDSPVGAVDRFAPEFDGLVARLNARLLSRMSQERDPRRRAAIYGFPRQLVTLRDNLASFLSDVFRGSRFDEAPMLRGVYFTSGTQEGTPIDRLMGLVARTFGVDPQALPAQGGRGRSYFLKSLLKHVVFRESEIAGTNRRFETQRAWLQRGAYAGSVLLTLLLAAAWTMSYLNNRTLVRDVAAATATAAAEVGRVGERDDALALLPALESVRAIPSAYDAHEGAPWLRGLGLGQGGRLRARAEAAYDKVLHEMLLARLMRRTEDHLRSGGPTSDFLYEALKAYLMLDSRDHYDAASVIGWFQYDFDQFLAPHAAPADRDAYFAHLNALFERQPLPLPLPLDAALITEKQAVVAAMRPEERIYNRIKRSSAAGNLKDFTIFDAAGPRSQIVFARRSAAGAGDGIDGFFTRAGYQQFFVGQSSDEVRLLIDESWILGDYTPKDLDQTAVLARVKNLYLDEFADQYDALLADVQLAPFSTPAEASNILNVLSDPAGSPLLLLLRAVAQETELEPRANAGAAASTSSIGSAVDRLRQLAGGAQASAPAAASAATVVDNRFRWLRDFLGGGDPAAAPIAGVLKQLDELYRFMATVAAERGPEGALAKNVADQGRAVVQNVRTTAARQPQLVQGLLQDAASRSQNLAFSGVKANLNAQWQAEALPFCRQAIAGRYPVDRGSAQEIRLEDFGRFFGPGGLVDAYFKAYLADFVDTSSKPWRTRTTAATQVQLNPESVRQFERAAAIRDTYFRAGGALPAVSFDLKPLGTDPPVNQLTLLLGGKSIVYNNEAPRATRMQWPGADQNGDVRIEMAPPKAGESALEEQGPWAWFKVLDRATLTPGDRAERFQVEFKVGSRAAVYELTATSAYNPFRFAELDQFRCPEQL
jgi:type VI secretion system protein ImpL